MNTYATGMTAEYSASAEASIGIAKATLGWNVAVKFDNTRKENKSSSTTTVIKLSCENPVKVPPLSKQCVNVTIHTSRVNSKTYTTKAERWYDYRVTGSHSERRDARELRKRDETVQITVAGSLRGVIDVTFGKTEKL